MSAARRTTLALLLLCASAGATAFGALGHRLVAQQAESRLQPATLAEVRRLLGSERPGVLAEVASWADQVRDQRPQTAPWHYLNFPPGDCRYQPQRDCPDGQCLVAAVEAQLALLRDRSAGDAQRAEALKFVVHFIGDLHQPLHLGYAHDKGGNRFQIALDRRSARARPGDDAALQARRAWWAQQRGGYNLHWLWDSLLLDSLARSEAQWLQRLEALPAEAAEPAPPSATVAEQGCRLVQQAGTIYPPRHRIGLDYVERVMPLLERQLRLGGLRLAAVLDEALGTP